MRLHRMKLQRGQERGLMLVSEGACPWLQSAMTILHMWLKGRDHPKPSSQRPQSTRGRFQRQSWKKIIQSRLGYLPWIIAEPKCWKRVCLAFRHLRGSASQEGNSLVLCFSLRTSVFYLASRWWKGPGSQESERTWFPKWLHVSSTGLRILQAKIRLWLFPFVKAPHPPLYFFCHHNVMFLKRGRIYSIWGFHTNKGFGKQMRMFLMAGQKQ